VQAEQNDEVLWRHRAQCEFAAQPPCTTVSARHPTWESVCEFCYGTFTPFITDIPSTIYSNRSMSEDQRRSACALRSPNRLDRTSRSISMANQGRPRAEITVHEPQKT
jgi:hypothetical protein